MEFSIDEIRNAMEIMHEKQGEEEAAEAANIIYNWNLLPEAIPFAITLIQENFENKQYISVNFK